MGDSGPPLLKNAHVLPKNGPKMPILGKKTLFFGLGWSVRHAPTPILQMSDATKNVFKTIGASK